MKPRTKNDPPESRHTLFMACSIAAIFLYGVFTFYAIPPATAQPETAKPEIIADEAAQTLRVLVGGREIVTIDASGLHVRGDITYTGVTIDNGSAYESP